MRLVAYTGVSATLAGGVILKALHQRANFYSACVFLSQSNANLMILTNLCLLLVGFLLFGLQRLLYGRLRPIETEQLYEKAWFAVTETCLAMTIFRGELGGWFLVMFICLLVGKVWGWIGEGRVEILEQQPPSNPRLFHTRLATSLLLSVLFNSYMLEYAVKTVLRQARPDMMVMFGFEFAVLTILSTSVTARYAISLAEIYIVRQQKKEKLAERRAELRAQREAAEQQGDAAPEQSSEGLPHEDDIDEMELDVPGWEEKGRWVFYLDLLTDFFKLVVYLSFFAILFTFYGLPIHILRDVVLTMRSFAKRILDFLRYRNATRDMNQRYPDATAEEISREDVCIICREEMHPWQPPVAAEGGAGAARPTVSERLRPKKLPCGHLLHFACLRSWLERQQNCPTCRRPVATVRRGGSYTGRDGGRADGANQQGNGANDRAPAAGEGRPRLWVLNFGPVRIGFGAGRGEMLQNLDQQVQDGRPQGGQAPGDRNIPMAGQAQRIGFGFGIGRPPAPPPPPPTTNSEFNHQNIQNQIQQLEQQVNQEISNLVNTADQLQIVRLLQGELARLRAAQTTNNVPTTEPSSSQTTGVQPPSGTVPTPSPVSSPLTAATQRSFPSNSQISSMASGDSRLPEGLTLPSGWTLVPLRRGQQHGQQTEHSTVTSSTVVTPSSSRPTSLPPFTSSHLSHTSTGESSSVNFQPQEGANDNNIRSPNPSDQLGPTTSRRPSQLTPLVAQNPRSEEVNATTPTFGGDQQQNDTPRNSTSPVESPEAGAEWGFDNLSTESVDNQRKTDDEDGTQEGESGKGKAREPTVEDVDED